MGKFDALAKEQAEDFYAQHYPGGDGSSVDLNYETPRGQIKWPGRQWFIGRAFVGQSLGPKLAEDLHWEVSLGKQLIGQLHGKEAGGMRPARWQRKGALKVQ